MRIHTLLFVLPIAFLPAAAHQKPAEKSGGNAAAQESKLAIPTQYLSPLDGVVKQLAKGGREREVNDLLDALGKLGYPPANLDKLRKSAKEDLGRAKSVIDALPSGAKQLRVTATQLVAIMEKMEDGEDKQDLARQIIVLDGECEAAHTVLGNVKVGTTWVRSEFQEMRKRRGEMIQKVEEAKRLAVDIETGEVDDEYIQQACGVKATLAKRGYFELHSNFSVEKTGRILREASRAYAMGMWLQDKGLTLPHATGGKPSPKVWVLIDSREQYKKLAADLITAGKVSDEDAKLLNDPNTSMNGFFVKDGPKIQLAQVETSVESPLLVAMANMQEDNHTPLQAGHLNWLTLSFLGCTLPSYVFKDQERRRGRGDTHVENEDDKRTREELLRLAKAGIAGSRTWMQYLAGRNEDPPFRDSFVPRLGMISGNDLHKCTSMVEFLHEANLFRSLYRKLGTDTKDPVGAYNTALSTLGEDLTLGALESQWRSWLLGGNKGVAERIDKENLNAYPPDALSVLEYMNDIREKAFKGKIEGVWKLKFDPDLSEACGLHAQYLEMHPEQQKWPDAHEEYPDKEGYTTEGAWAAAHSVILFGGTGQFKDSVDGWMGTFYHRLPLIDPGVLRLGWGKEELNTVMDMQSLAAPYDKAYVVLYPYDRQNDVPTKFDGNEFPDPVPDKELNAAAGERDQVNEGEIFGYPITIQTNPLDESGATVDIDMKLYEGAAKDKNEVECYFSSPSKPSNPEIAPAGAWCLIPKAFLKGHTEYRVVAVWTTKAKGGGTSAGKRTEWTFRTK